MSRLVNSSAVVGVHHKDQALCALEIVAPERSNLVLPTDIPYIELDLLIGHCLDVEADGRDGGDVLAELESVEDGWALAVSK